MPLIRRGSPDTAPAALGGPDLETAVAALRNGSPDDRWSAARALATILGAAPVLGRALATETDERVREAIFTSLARIDGPESLDAVLPCVRSDDANLRTGALDALRLMCASMPGRLESLLHDPDVDVRILACDLARDVAPDVAASLLSAVIETDSEVNVCAAAVDVLAEVGSAAALPSLALCAARFPDQPFLAFAVRVASERIGDPADGPHG